MTCLTVQQSPAAVRTLGEVLDALEAELGPDPEPRDRELLTLVQSALLISGCDEKATIAAVREPVRAAGRPSRGHPRATADAGHDDRAERDGGHLRGADGAAGPPCAARLGSRDSATGRCSSPRSPSAWPTRSRTRWRRWTARCGTARRTPRCGRTSLALSTRALMLHGIGAIPDALADAQTAVEIIGHERWGSHMTMPQIALATVLVDRGEPERAEELLEPGRPAEPGRLRHGVPLVPDGPRPGPLGARRRPDRARPAARLRLRSLEEAGFTNPAFVALVGRGGLSAAPPSETRRRGPGRRRARRRARPPVGHPARPRTRRARPRHDHPRGDRRRTAHRIGRATCPRSPARAEHARAEYLLGARPAGRRRPRGAREHLRTAADLAQRCGALALAKDGPAAAGAPRAAGCGRSPPPRSTCSPARSARSPASPRPGRATGR